MTFELEEEKSLLIFSQNLEFVFFFDVYLHLNFWHDFENFLKPTPKTGKYLLTLTTKKRRTLLSSAFLFEKYVVCRENHPPGPQRQNGALMKTALL